MADESANGGILGHLPPWPRNALNNSVIAMEQAYRQRKGLPLLSDADIEALKAGQPMAWESGNGGTAPVVASPAPPPVSASAPPAAIPAVAASTGLSEDVAKWVAEGRKWSKSTIAAEQARRGRKGLPALNDFEIAALLGEPVAAAEAPAAPVPAAASTPTPAVASGPISADVAKWVAEGRKWSKSTIAAEQARRGRKGLPTLNDAEIAALLGEPAAPAAAPAASVPVAAAAAVPRPAAAQGVTASAAASVARSGESTSYVGTPAVGTSKAAKPEE
jgi:hypothetical protein